MRSRNGLLQQVAARTTNHVLANPIMGPMATQGAAATATHMNMTGAAANSNLSNTDNLRNMPHQMS